MKKGAGPATKYIHPRRREVGNVPRHSGTPVVGARQPAGQGLILAALAPPNGQQQDSGHFPHPQNHLRPPGESREPGGLPPVPVLEQQGDEWDGLAEADISLPPVPVLSSGAETSLVARCKALLLWHAVRFGRACLVPPVQHKLPVWVAYTHRVLRDLPGPDIDPCPPNLSIHRKKNGRFLWRHPLTRTPAHTPDSAPATPPGPHAESDDGIPPKTTPDPADWADQPPDVRAGRTVAGA